MRTRTSVSLAAILLATIGNASADEPTPAWQEPGYVMEEVVVTAPAVRSAWMPGFPAWIRLQHVLARHALRGGSRPDATHPEAE